METRALNSTGFLFAALVLTAAFALTPGLSFASSTDGTIDSSARYTWSENGGWIDFGASGGNVHVTDAELTGYAWSESAGWISLNCSNDSSCATADYKVSNDGEGNLSGYAWTENAGWIDFDPAGGGITIDSSGDLAGYAWGEDIGWVVFNCSTTSTCGTVSYKVSTDWRPRGARPQCNNASDDDGDGKTDYPADPGCASADDTSESDPAAASSGGGGPPVGLFGVVTSNAVIPAIVNPIVTLAEGVAEGVSEAAKSVTGAIGAILPDFLKPKPKLAAPEAPPPPQVLKTAPAVMEGNWSLLPESAIGEFALAPLPRGIQALAAKFPELSRTLKDLGIKKVSDMEKLRGVTLHVPGLTARAGLRRACRSPICPLKPRRPFPRNSCLRGRRAGWVDYSVAASVGDTGSVSEKISVVSGQQLNLVIKPDGPARSVKGYLVFQSAAAKTAVDIPQKSLLAAAVFALPVFAEKTDKAVPVERKLVLQEFEYTDQDGDGIYAANIRVPVVAGEYEVFTVIEYVDPEMGTRQVRMTAVIDPEGYVYELNNGKETRIPRAQVSIYRLNSASGAYELWPAKEYQQQNPQTTGVSGAYSFLVPVGSYYIAVGAPGYETYKGEPFDVAEGSGVHQNIEMHAVGGWLKLFDWKTLVIAIVALLLLYNFYRDRRRSRLAGYNKRTV